VSRRAPSPTDPNVLAAVVSLGAFWWFLYRATDAQGKPQPAWIRWATWW
jgi:hypothetical protein